MLNREILVQEIGIPNTNLAIRSLPNYDFADAFKCQLPGNRNQNIDSVTRAIFSTIPQWITVLMELRNAIVRPFGLKTSIDAEPSIGEGELRTGTAVGIFEVLERGLNEIMLGEDDNHLDYRVSIQLESEDEKCCVVVCTVVKFNNLFGQAYFVPVKPVHKIIIPAMMEYGLGG